MTVTRTRKVPLAVMPVTPFGKYNLIGKLGHGGMAEVFLAYVAGPAGFRKLVVIKRLHHQLEEEPGFLDMFLDEARLAARLNHGNIVQCFEVGDVEGSHFIAMEYLEGQGLDRIRRHCVREGLRLPEPVVARMLIDALDGLSYAHELKDFDGSPLKIVHRDVSPQNVFVTYDGVVKLLDFGIAKATTHVVETRTGVVKGKFAYMAPEQARGGEIDHRADLWSMGVVLWETLANRRLFKGPNDLATLNQALMGDIPELAEIVPDAPERLLEITRKSLSREVEDRYQTAQEMKVELEQAFSESDVGLATRSDVSEFVKGLFEEVIEQHRKVLQVCLSDSSAAAGLASGKFRVTEHTPADLRMTPSNGFDSSGSGPAVMSTPSGQVISTVSQSGQPVSSNSAMIPIGMQQQQGSGFAGKAGILIGAVLLAVLTTLLVLWIAGPDNDEEYRGDRYAENRAGQGSGSGSGGESAGESAGESGENQVPENVAVPSEETESPASAGGEGEAEPGESAGAEEEGEQGSDEGEGGAEEESEASASSTPAAPTKTPPVVRRPIRPRRGSRPINRPRNTQKQAPSEEEATDEEPATEPETPAEPPTKRRPEPEAFGFLTLDTIPWSQVSVSGRSLGNTPVIRARLPVGTHTLTFRNPEAGLSTTYRVTIRDGETTTRRLGLQ